MATIVLSGGRLVTNPSQLTDELAKHQVHIRRSVDLDKLQDLVVEWEGIAFASPSKQVRVYILLMVQDLRELFDLRSPIVPGEKVEGDNLEGGI